MKQSIVNKVYIFAALIAWFILWMISLLYISEVFKNTHEDELDTLMGEFEKSSFELTPLNEENQELWDLTIEDVFDVHDPLPAGERNEHETHEHNH